LEEEYDFVFIHDPQPAAIPSPRGTRGARWAWRCHIYTASPTAETWAFIRPFLSAYDAAVFTLEKFVPPALPIERVEIIPPAIDPLSPKNRALDDTTAREILDWIGVDADRPLVTQISRFDPWKDPLGVIAAYRQARESMPQLQLALAGSMALDDPEGWDVYREISAAAGDDPLIHVFTNLTGVGNIEVNAFQRVSDVVVQKSIRRVSVASCPRRCGRRPRSSPAGWQRSSVLRELQRRAGGSAADPFTAGRLRRPRVPALRPPRSRPWRRTPSGCATGPPRAAHR
jgi:trehalose synthase